MDRSLLARSFALGAAIAGLVAGPASAQYAETMWRGVGIQTGLINGKNTDTGTRLALDVDLGTVGKPWLGLTAGVGVASADLTDLGRDRSGDMKDVFLRGLVHANWQRDGRIHPRLTAGLGVHRLKVEVPEDDALERALDGTKFGAEFGFGTAYVWKPNLILNADVTRVLVPDLNHWSYNVGFTWRFRGTESYARAVTSRRFGSSTYTEARPVTVAPSRAGDTTPRPSQAEADVRRALARIDAQRRAATTTPTAPPLGPTRAEEVMEARAALVSLATRLGSAAEVGDVRREIRVRSDELSFPSARSELSVPGLELVARISRVLVRHPSIHLFIEGHTDSTGGVARNFAISEERARTVRDAFQHRGVPAGQITLVPMASGAPRAAERTSADRAANRRVELRLVLIG